MMNPTTILQSFLSRDETRPEIQRPLRYGANVYATDGRIMIRMPLTESEEPADTSAKLPKGFKPVVAGWRLTAEEAPLNSWHPLSEFTLPPPGSCPDCDGSGWLKPCPECEGTGGIECGECGHHRSCNACRSGSIPGEPDDENAIECDWCEGDGLHEHNGSHPVGTAHVSNGYLRKIAGLPGAEIFLPDWPANECRAVPFRFEGGAGCVMPMRRPVETLKAKSE